VEADVADAIEDVDEVDDAHAEHRLELAATTMAVTAASVARAGVDDVCWSALSANAEAHDAVS
jgi:hypothetical protein